ncbi:MAG: O-antigen ligase family protein [Clostridia bacterium]|nr:O-antigen ligase family protein [Clostridia bacterium]
MNNFKIKARSFLESKYCPLLLAILTLISHTFSLEPIGFVSIILCAIVGLLICEDLKFLIAPLFLFIFAFSEKSVASKIYYSKPYIIAMICTGIVVLCVFIAHFIIYKRHVSWKSFKGSKLFLGLVLLLCSFLLNGALNFDGYEYGNIIYALILSLCLFGVFFIFYSNLKPNSQLYKHLLYVLYLVSLVLTLQLYFSFFNQIQIVDGEIVKESVMFGWGMWNNMGGMLAFLLPVHFYYASTVKKFGFAFYVTGIMSFLAIVLTLSRSSLLASVIAIVICVIISCFAGNNKLINRIITISLAILGIVGIILLWDKISNILGDYLARGFDDNGRFEMYYHGLWNFLENPIFGGGFYSAYKLEHQFISFLPFRYHNTFVQMAGTCGAFGLVSYVWHRYETIKLFLSKKTLYSLFIAISIGSMLFGSLLDNHFFNLYPTFIYSVMLVVLEKSNSTNTQS